MPEMNNPMVVGWVRPDPKDTSSERAGGTLVVKYEANTYFAGASDVFVMFPLDTRGLAARPFGDDDDDAGGRKPEAIRASLDPARRDEILALRVDDAAYAGAKKLVQSSAFVPVGYPGGVSRTCFRDQGNQGIKVIAYVPPGAPAPVGDPRAGVRGEIPRGAFVVVLPDSIPRPPAEQSGDVARVLFMTPAYLALDVIVTPPLLLALLTSGPRC